MLAKANGEACDLAVRQENVLDQKNTATNSEIAIANQDAAPKCPTASERRTLLINGVAAFDDKYPEEGAEELVDRMIAAGDLPKLCERCGNPFTPRSRSGGSPQRFCSRDCRMEWHSGQRSPAYTTLPGIFDQQDEKSPAEASPSEDPFDWGYEGSIALQEQVRTAVYIGTNDHLVIRQERQWDQEDDTYILISPHNITAFIEKLTAVVGIPSGGRP